MLKRRLNLDDGVAIAVGRCKPKQELDVTDFGENELVDHGRVGCVVASDHRWIRVGWQGSILDRPRQVGSDNVFKGSIPISKQVGGIDIRNGRIDKGRKGLRAGLKRFVLAWGSRQGGVGRKADRGRNVILQVGTDTRQVDHRRNVGLGEIRFGADA